VLLLPVGKAEEEARQAAKQIEGDAELRELSRNPLLLVFLALLHELEGRIPDRRSLLYGKVADVLLDRWERARARARGSGVGSRSLALGDTRRVIGALAWWMLAGGREEVSTAELRDELARIERERGATPEQAGSRAEALADVLRTGSAVLTASAHGHWQFVHATLAEYFAGVEMARGGARWDQVLTDVFRPDWQEIVTFCAGDLGVRAEDSRLEVLGRALLFKHRGGRPAANQVTLLGAILREDPGFAQATTRALVERFEAACFEPRYSPQSRPAVAQAFAATCIVALQRSWSEDFVRLLKDRTSNPVWREDQPEVLAALPDALAALGEDPSHAIDTMVRCPIPVVAAAGREARKKFVGESYEEPTSIAGIQGSPGLRRHAVHQESVGRPLHDFQLYKRAFTKILTTGSWPNASAVYMGLRLKDVVAAHRLRARLLAARQEDRFRNLMDLEDFSFSAPEGDEVRLQRLRADLSGGVEDGEWITDEVFGRLRTSGPNPFALLRVVAEFQGGVGLPLAAIRGDIPDVEERWAARAPGGGTLADSIARREVFAVDFRAQRGLDPGGLGGVPRAPLSGPVALFWATPAGTLAPVAIACHAQGSSPRVCYPGEAGWEAAKMEVHVADFLDHECRGLLARVLLILQQLDGTLTDPECRGLAGTPAGRFLRPFFESVRVNIEMGTHTFRAGVDGIASEVLNASMASVSTLISAGRAAWTVGDLDPLAELARRGFDGSLRLRYPYERCVRSLWPIFATYVRELLGTDEPGVLKRAHALRTWLGVVNATLAPEGPHVPLTAEGATTLVAGTAFLSSVIHSALSSPQADLLAIPRLFPGAIYAPLGDTPDGSEMLVSAAANQIAMLRFFGGRRFECLPALPAVPGHEAAHLAFLRDLKFLEETLLIELNTGKLDDYDYLLPSRIAIAANV
jgi:hypothetical protein